MILCLGTTPAAQRVMVFNRLALDAVNRATRTVDGAAGKAINVGKVLQALGAKPLLTGFLGGLRGQQLETLLRARSLDCDFVHVQTPTRECVTVIEGAGGTVTELVEESQPVEPEAYEKLLRIVEDRVPSCQAVVMSGTIASGGPPDLYYKCTELAHRAGALAIADASGPALVEVLKAKPTLVKPNLPELEATVGRQLPDESSVRTAIQELQARGAENVVITAGARPALAYDGQRFWKVTAPRIKAVNPIGSGDAFTAGLVWQLVQRADLGTACRWACAAGAANALTLMAGELTREEVERLADQVQVKPL